MNTDINIYRRRFVKACPANAMHIVFEFELQLKKAQMVMVEDIDAFVYGLDSAYHEPIADQLFAKFGGFQILKAMHHGTEIETRRGKLE